jgi:hypothetical protein
VLVRAFVNAGRMLPIPVPDQFRPALEADAALGSG